MSASSTPVKKPAQHAPNSHSVTNMDLDSRDTESSANSQSRSSRDTNDKEHGVHGGGPGGHMHKRSLVHQKDSTAQHRPKFSLTFQNIPEEAEVSSAERKSVSLSDTSHSPYTLFFTRPALEADFRRALAQTLHSSKRIWALSLLLLFVCVVVRDAYYFRTQPSDAPQSTFMGAESAFLQRLVLGVLGWAVILVIFVAMAIPACAHRFPQVLLSFAFVLSGCLFALESTLSNHDLQHANDCSVILAFLVIYHTLARLYLFPFIVVSSWMVTLLYMALAWAVRDSEETAVHTLSVSLYVVLCNITLCYSSYMHESYKRRMFIANQEILHESRKLKKETHDLRGEIWEMVMEKYSIADTSRKTIDLTSPVEKAMDILKAMQSDADMSQRAQSQVLEVIRYIGSSSEIFKPSLDQVLNNKVLDTNTTRWLASLVDHDQQPPKRQKRNRSPESVTMESELHAVHKVDPTLFPQGAAFIQSMTSVEEELYARVQQNFDDWDMDVFDVAKLTNGHPLFFVGMSIFRKFDWISKFNLDMHRVCNFFTGVEQGYHANKPYHNNIHAADVTRTVHYFLSVANMKAYLSDLEMLAVILAAAVHDFDHPGLSNTFLVRQRDQKAVLYNDKSVLENHHCAHAFKLLLRPENNFLINLPRKDFDYLRKLVIEMVLATDLSCHFELITHFKTLSAAGQIDKSSEQSKVLMLKMALKCGDVGHAAKKLPLHLKWTERVVEEFFQQGDIERKLGTPISPFMDRQKANVPKAQQGFIDFLVLPMFEAWSRFLSDTHNALVCSGGVTPSNNNNGPGGAGAHDNNSGPASASSSSSVITFSADLQSATALTPLLAPSADQHMRCLMELRSNRDHWFNLLEASEKEGLLAGSGNNSATSSTVSLSVNTQQTSTSLVATQSLSTLSSEPPVSPMASPLPSHQQTGAASMSVWQPLSSLLPNETGGQPVLEHKQSSSDLRTNMADTASNYMATAEQMSLQGPPLSPRHRIVHPAPNSLSSLHAPSAAHSGPLMHSPVHQQQLSSVPQLPTVVGSPAAAGHNYNESVSMNSAHSVNSSDSPSQRYSNSRESSGSSGTGAGGAGGSGVHATQYSISTSSAYSHSHRNTHGDSVSSDATGNASSTVTGASGPLHTVHEDPNPRSGQISKLHSSTSSPNNKATFSTASPRSPSPPTHVSPTGRSPSVGATVPGSHADDGPQ